MEKIKGRAHLKQKTNETVEVNFFDFHEIKLNCFIMNFHIYQQKNYINNHQKDILV